jgi:hypothetical protein
LKVLSTDPVKAVVGGTEEEEEEEEEDADENGVGGKGRLQ